MDTMNMMMGNLRVYQNESISTYDKSLTILEGSNGSLFVEEDIPQMDLKDIFVSSKPSRKSRAN